MDPLAEKYIPISPYIYGANNPIYFIDVNGKDIYRYDEKTGEFVLAVSNKDKFDQVGKFKYDKKTGEYKLQTNKKGETKSFAGLGFEMRKDLFGKIEPIIDFHLHPSSSRYSESDRLRPSSADLNKRDDTMKYFPVVKQYIILTKGFDPVDYTKYR